MQEKPNYYSIIPADVRYDNDLKDKAKLLYGEITSLSDKQGYCYATNKYFAELYNVSNTTISLLIKNLIDKGYVESEIIYKENSKEIASRYLRIVKGGYLRNLKEGYLKKVKGNNNTSNINNTSINKEIYKEIVEYLNLKANTNYKDKSSKTQSLIQARLNEGFTKNDFKIVIDNKCSSWLDTEMSKYIRPETLFGTKFESYLNEKPTKRKETEQEWEERMEREIKEMEESERKRN